MSHVDVGFGSEWCPIFHETWAKESTTKHGLHTKKEKEADNFNLQWGGATFVGIRCTDNAKEHKLEGLDMMIHLAASLYLVAFQLVQMAQSFKGENLEEKLLEQRTILRQTFVEDKWKDKKESCVNWAQNKWRSA